MPYYFSFYEAPEIGSNDLEEIGRIWNDMKNDLLAVIFETEEEAVAQKFRKHTDPTGACFNSWELARFRQTDDREQLLYAHDLGLEALAYTESAIKSGKIDTNFLYYWGMLSGVTAT